MTGTHSIDFDEEEDDIGELLLQAFSSLRKDLNNLGTGDYKPREKRFSAETDRLGRLMHQRGDMRIGQLIVNAVRDDIEYPSDAENPEQEYADRFESYLFNVEDDDLVELVEDFVFEMEKADYFEGRD